MNSSSLCRTSCIRKRIHLSILTLALLPLANFATSKTTSETWPQFRGPNGAAYVQDQSIPTKLNEKSLRWSAELPGPGSSSPVVWGSRVFVTSEIREEGRIELVCLDAISGEKIWSQSKSIGDYRTHQFNNTAAGTPSVTNGLVVFSWYDARKSRTMLGAYTHNGELVWEKAVSDYQGRHGATVSPVIRDGLVIMGLIHSGGGHVQAFALKDGSPIWKSSEFSGGKTSYITPLIREKKESDGVSKEVIIVANSIGMVALDFASGRKIWSLPDVFTARTIASPILAHKDSETGEDLIMAGCKSGVFLAARTPRWEGEKRISEPQIAWAMESRTPYVPTPVSSGRVVYALEDGGTLAALDAETGVERWTGRMPGNFYASPLLVGDKLYCLSRAGEMWIVNTGERFEVLATHSLNPPEDVTWCDATPAVAHNRIYIRLGSRLDCF